MRDQYEELTEKLDSFADWLEGANNVHCPSLPRRASFTIKRLEEENHQMRLQINKRDVTLIEIVNRYIGMIRLWIYLFKKRINTPKG